MKESHRGLALRGHVPSACGGRDAADDDAYLCHMPATRVDENPSTVECWMKTVDNLPD